MTKCSSTSRLTTNSRTKQAVPPHLQLFSRTLFKLIMDTISLFFFSFIIIQIFSLERIVERSECEPKPPHFLFLKHAFVAGKQSFVVSHILQLSALSLGGFGNGCKSTKRCKLLDQI